MLIGTPAVMCADVVRLATYDAGLTAKGPSLFLCDIAGAGSPRLRATLSLLTQGAPDILILVGWIMIIISRRCSACATGCRRGVLSTLICLPTGQIQAWQRRLILMAMTASLGQVMRRDLAILPVQVDWLIYQNFQTCMNGPLI